jgi:hypothetical protein
MVSERNNSVPLDVSRPALCLLSLSDSIRAGFSQSADADDFRVEYLLSNLTKKFADGSTDAEFLRSAAYARLKLSETMCSTFNRNGIGGYFANDLVWVEGDKPLNLPRRKAKASGYVSNTQSDIYLRNVLQIARDFISETLGPLSYEWVNHCKLSNGASLGHKRANAYPVAKLSGDFNVTPKAKPYLLAFKGLCNPRIFKNVNIRLCSGNRLDTVPKNNETDRCIAIEPEGNLLLQKGLGSWLKTRLAMVGVNLRSQQRNRELARFLRLCTIDLSMASDTVSQEIVFRLLPYEWFDLFDSLRSHYGETPWGLVKWEKFSSMGNGFTFELETLIFHSLTYAVSHVELGSYDEASFATFGDDIIAPVELYKSLSHVLKECGFVMNPEKSFATGPFRESCGKHYWDGHDVSPFYIRKPVDELSRYIWLGNSFRKWCDLSATSVCDPRGYDIWRAIADVVPKMLRGGRDLESTESLVSTHKPNKRLVPVLEEKTEMDGWRPVAAWLLQAGRQDTRADAQHDIRIRQVETDLVDDLCWSFDTVYSARTPYWLRGLVSAASSVLAPRKELGYRLKSVFQTDSSGIDPLLLRSVFGRAFCADPYVAGPVASLFPQEVAPVGNLLR